MPDSKPTRDYMTITKPPKSKPKENPAGWVWALIAAAAIGGGIGAYILYKRLVFSLSASPTSVTVSQGGVASAQYTVTGAHSGDSITIYYATEPSPNATDIFSPAGGSGTADSSGTYVFTDQLGYNKPGTFLFYVSAYNQTQSKYSNWVTMRIVDTG